MRVGLRLAALMSGRARDRRAQSSREAQTRLAETRMRLGATQKRTAAVVGLSLTTYRRLERGEIEHPPLAWLRNLAIAFDVEVDEILEPDWGMGWTELDARAAGPPAPGWRQPPEEDWFAPGS